ncbi:hypothetical protein [Niabella aquatica]
MKILQACLVAAENSSLVVFEKIVAEFKSMTVTGPYPVENAIDAMPVQQFDLLILDKALPAEALKKLNRVGEILLPDAAIIEFHLMDEDFIRFRLTSIMAKWEEARSESQINFMDGPDLKTS